MTRHFTRLIKSIRKLGLINGLVVFGYYVYHRLVPARKWSSRQVHVSTISRPVWIRPGVSDWIVMERIFLDAEYDPISAAHDDAMDRKLQSILDAGRQPLIVDCGANIGLSSVWFAERFPKARIIAVEPEPANYGVLRLNAQNFPAITPIHAAVSDHVSHVTLSNASDTPWAWQTQETEAGGTETITIPQIFAMAPDCTPMIVKVDIEGFEVNLLRSNTEWTEDLALMVFEMHDWMKPWSGSGHAFMFTLARQKRDYLLRGENVFSYSHSALEHVEH